MSNFQGRAVSFKEGITDIHLVIVKVFCLSLDELKRIHIPKGSMGLVRIFTYEFTYRNEAFMDVSKKNFGSTKPPRMQSYAIVKHQDYEPFLVGNPYLNLHLKFLTGTGARGGRSPTVRS